MIALVLLFICSIIMGVIVITDFNNEISSYDYEILISITEAFADNGESTTN